MAISKHQKAPDKPNAAAFTRLIDEGLAEPEVVSEAYQAALREWKHGVSYARLLAMAAADGGIVQHRSEIDWDADDGEPTPEARLVLLDRARLFDNTEPSTIRRPRPKQQQEEA